MKTIVNLISLAILAMNLLACSHSDHKKTTAQTYVIKKEALHKTLFFTGTIQPLHESSLSTPMDATIETMNCHYGQWVKKGAVIFTLNSTELQKLYNDTLTEYLKAKDSYAVTRAKFTGTKELWSAGLLSKNNYMSEQSSLATVRVSLMQATRKLNDLLEKVDNGSDNTLTSLSLTDFDKVKDALSASHNLIYIKAPADGILLYPPKAQDDKSGKAGVGSVVKAGQSLGLVGDLSGLSVEIDIPEVDIDKVRAGMPATITGVALGQQVLHGELVAVNAQASNTGSGGLPSFSAVVEVTALNDEQRALIKVGMSASIQLDIDSDNQLMIPIRAVRQDKGLSLVKRQNTKGQSMEQIITTGSAQADKVVVASGLKEGDVIAYD